jgi:hypothetical protein
VGRARLTSACGGSDRKENIAKAKKQAEAKKKAAIREV